MIFNLVVRGKQPHENRAAYSEFIHTTKIISDEAQQVSVKV